MFSCNVNELKKANNLTTEQDFFALRTIKIPVRKHGIHHDNMTSHDMTSQSDMTSYSPCDEEPLLPETPEKVRKQKDGSVFLKSVDREIEKVANNNQ